MNRWVDWKTLITGLVASLVGALGAAALFTVSRLGEATAMNNAMETAQEDLRTITGSATKATTAGQLVEQHQEEARNALANIRETQRQSEKTAQEIRDLATAFHADAKLRNIADAIINDSSLRVILAAEIGRLANPRLKVTSFKAIFHSQNKSAKEVREYAGDDGQWSTFQLNPDGSSYVHDAEFGSRVVATWWIARRGTNGAGWGKIEPSPDGRRVRIGGSAIPDAGAIEASVFVLYEE